MLLFALTFFVRACARARSQLGEYIAALEIKYDLNLTILRIFTMVGNMVFLAHMLGCFWFYTAALVGINEDTTTWVSSYDDGSAMYADPSVQYLYSVYWALTTLTTVRVCASLPPVLALHSLFGLLSEGVCVLLLHAGWLW